MPMTLLLLLLCCWPLICDLLAGQPVLGNLWLLVLTILRASLFCCCCCCCVWLGIVVVVI
jgi:hypothetical protein